MMGICPTGGQANNILKYENFDTGGMCAKTFKSGGDGFDLALDEQHGADIQVPPDSRGDVSDLQATADDELVQVATDNDVAELTILPGPDPQWGVGIPMGTSANPAGQKDPADGIGALVPPDDRGDDLHPTRVSAGVVLGTVEQGDA